MSKNVLKITDVKRNAEFYKRILTIWRMRNVGCTFQSIADSFHVSRQRVHQLYTEHIKPFERNPRVYKEFKIKPPLTLSAGENIYVADFPPCTAVSNVCANKLEPV